jgi:chromosome segregation and condensation protein ScpB
MELRAEGLPLAKIAAEIEVSNTTLIKWDQEFKEEIANLRSVELEAPYDKYDLSTRKKVAFFWRRSQSDSARTRNARLDVDLD